jgi:hypothetical protein
LTGNYKARGAPDTSEIAQIVDLINKYGVEINEISKRSGQFKETVRYRVKEKILNRGMAVQAVVDAGVIGLRRIAFKVTMGDAFAEYAPQIFVSMNQLCYVHIFQTALPEDFYLVHASVPIERVEEFKDLMLRLKDLGIFSSIRFYEFEWSRRVPMKAEYYDFNRGAWDFDWSSPKSSEPDITLSRSRGGRPVDRIDLLILKELQIDASKNLVEIRDSIGRKDGYDINYKTLNWHYSHHVLASGLISGYSVRWLGTNYDETAEKPRQRQHKYMVVNLLVENVTEAERMLLIGKMNRLPFLWFEAAGKDYMAQCAFPLEMMTEAMEYLKDVMKPFDDRAEYFMEDQKNSVSFTVNHKLWNEETKKWRFEKADLLARFENLVVKINRGPVRGG